MNKFYLLIIFFLFLLIYYPNTIKSSKLINETQISKVTELENLYHLKIHTKNNALINTNSFIIEPQTNEDIINKSLEQITKQLSKFPPPFFDIFYKENYEGLNIYLTGSLTPKNKKSTLSNPAAFSLVSNSKYIMVLDITNSNISNLFCHELMHNIEFTLNDEFIFPDWNSYNPKDFLYDLSYTKKSNSTYTLSTLNPEDIYFIDPYSKTYPDEDRARIFEYLCTENINISKYENLSLKAQYLQKELLNYYPILKSSAIFTS